MKTFSLDTDRDNKRKPVQEVLLMVDALRIPAELKSKVLVIEGSVNTFSLWIEEKQITPPTHLREKAFLWRNILSINRQWRRLKREDAPLHLESESDLMKILSKHKLEE
jgi:hypothetical protein